MTGINHSIFYQSLWAYSFLSLLSQLL